ncbi:MAG TPA: hypothetical protein VLB76_10255 [Thermoanaerobaculia bacterium]|jgi:hypothetical protein|nr:hypothetical protein [Thermoanaerobaculia bacterium]
MNTPVYNAQFLTIDFRMLDNRAFGEFMKTTAFAVYLQIRRYIWRSRTRRHPIAQVNELLEKGNLVATVERSYLAEKLGIKEERHISRHISELCRMGVIQRISTGRQNIYILGNWEDRSVQRDGSYVIELFLLEQHFGVEHRPQIIATEGHAAALPEEVPMSNTSEVSFTDTSQVSPKKSSRVSAKRSSGVSRKPPYKYRTEEIEKQQQAALLLKGFPFSQAQLAEIAATYSIERVREVVTAYEQRSEGKIENPSGWVLAALKGGYDFDSAAKRVRVKYEQRRGRQAAQADAEALAEAARQELAARVQAWIEDHPQEYGKLVEAERKRWRGSSTGESERFLHTCARVRVQELLAEDRERAPDPHETPFLIRQLSAAPAERREFA